MPLADALSFVPSLATAPADPAADAAALTRLAEWCGRYSPWTAPDGVDGIKIEITGCAHLWGGESALAADLARRLARPINSERGIACRIAVAGTFGAAWALARYAPAETNPAIVATGAERAALAPLPVEALRLNPDTVRDLRRVGLRRIGELCPMPREALARRFGEQVAHRLDQAFGDLPEPLSPLGEAPLRRVRLSFAEPILDPADLVRAIERLVHDLVPRLAREGVGARRLVLGFHRVDGRVEHIAVGTARPSRDPRHLAALFTARLDTVDPGLGIEDTILAVFAVDPLPPEQGVLLAPSPLLENPLPPAGGEGRVRGVSETDIASLIDRLGNRFGLDALRRLEPRESHIPEKASIYIPFDKKEASIRNSKMPRGRVCPVGLWPTDLIRGHPRLEAASDREKSWMPGTSPGTGLSFLGENVAKPPRPVRLLQPPEPVAASWLVPDSPPIQFAWRRRLYRVARADGPERIAAEWWTEDGSAAVDAIRDYYRVEDEEGRRFWLYRSGLAQSEPPPRWFVHGLFA
jgi:protein ImuB